MKNSTTVKSAVINSALQGHIIDMVKSDHNAKQLAAIAKHDVITSSRELLADTVSQYVNQAAIASGLQAIGKLTKRSNLKTALTTYSKNSRFIAAYSDQRKVIANRVNTWIKRGEFKQLNNSESIRITSKAVSISSIQKSAGSKKTVSGKMTAGSKSRTVRPTQPAPNHQGSQATPAAPTSSGKNARQVWIEQSQQLIASAKTIDLEISDVQKVIASLTAMVKMAENAKKAAAPQGKKAA